MKVFSFDKYWGIDWVKVENNIYEFRNGDYLYRADKSKNSNPKFSIFLVVSKSVKKCIADMLEEDTFIMQIKSIKENGKMVELQFINRK